MNNISMDSMFWDNIKKFNYHLLEELNLSSDQVDFINAVKALEKGELEMAEKLLVQLYTSASDEHLVKNSGLLLFQVLYSQCKWAKMFELNMQSDVRIDASFRDLSVISSNIENSEYYFLGNAITLPIQLSISGSPILDVQINEKKKSFWLDTGAIVTVLPSDTAELCNISLGKPIEATTSTSAIIETKTIVIEEIEFGNFNIKRLPALVMPTETLILKHPVTNETIKIDGIIGWDIIKYLDLTIDYKNKEITIKKPAINSPNSRNLFFCGYPIVKLANGEQTPLYFGLDTGAGKTVLGESIFGKVKFTDIKKITKDIGGAGGFIRKEVESVEHLLLLLGDRKIMLRDVFLGAFEPAEFFKLDGVLGSDIANNGSLRINYQEGIIEIK